MWGCLALIGLAATPSPEAPLAIAVIPSVARGDHGYLNGPEVEVDLRRAIAERPTLSANPPAGNALREKIASCGASVPCMAAGLSEEGYALGLRVAVDQRFSPPVFTAQLIEVDRSRVLREVIGDALSGDNLRAEIQNRVAALLEATGHPRLARVVVEVDPESAHVSVTPQPEHRGENHVFWLPEGDHTVEAESGAGRARTTIHAVPGRESVVRLALDTEETSVSPWMWGAIGVAVLGGAACIIAIAASSGVDCYCLATPGQTCPPCP